MDLLRIGDKVIDRQRVHTMVDRVLELREAGVSQQEAANILGTDRSFISRLESLGEIRKGGQIALVGFPIKNREEIEGVARAWGVDFVLLMTEKERWRYVEEKNGLQLLNELMALIARVRSYDTVIFLGSNMRLRLVEALLDKEVVGVELGPSPLADDVYVDPEEIGKLIGDLT